MKTNDWATYTTIFKDGSVVTCKGTCGADAGSRALRMRDKERGDRLAVIVKIVPEPGMDS